MYFADELVIAMQDIRMSMFLFFSQAPLIPHLNKLWDLQKIREFIKEYMFVQNRKSTIFVDTK